MADRTIKVTLKVDDQFSTPLAEYQTGLKNAESSSKSLNTTTENTKSGLDKFNTVLKAGIAIWGMKQSFGIIEDFTALGQEVHKTHVVFDQLAGDAQTAETRLKALQQATGGIVDNQTLMSAANAFSQMGLATTTDEMAKFTEMATKLGGAMGKDAAGALDEFGKMLANQSILRLDTFGISGSRVRERMNELAETTKDLTKEQRFLQAVMEEGGAAMARLGDAANVGQTSLARMQTGLENLKQGFAEAVAGGVELGSQIVETAGALATGALSAEEFVMALQGATSDELAAHIARRTGDLTAEQQQVYDTVEAYVKLQTTMASTPDSIGWTEQGIKDLLTAADMTGAVWKINPALVKGGGTQEQNAMLQDLQQQYMKASAAQFGLNTATELYGSLLGGIAAVEGSGFNMFSEVSIENSKEQQAELDKQYQKYKQYKDFLDTFTQQSPAALNLMYSGQMDIDQLNNLREYSKTMGDQLEDLSKLQEEGIITDKELRRAQQMKDTIDLVVSAVEQVGQKQGETAMADYTDWFTAAKDLFESDSIRDFGGFNLFSEGTVASLEKTKGVLDQQLADLQTLNEQGFVTDDDVAKAQSMADEIGRMADEAAAARDAVNSMSLDQLLGRTSGGVGGEISDAVMQALSDAGLSPEVMAGLQAQVDLGTGRESAFGQAFTEQIVPLLAEVTKGMGGAEGAEAMNRVAEAIKEGRLAGMSDEQLVESVTQAVGYKIDEKTGALQEMSVAEKMGVKPGDIGGMMSALLGLSPDMNFTDILGVFSGGGMKGRGDQGDMEDMNATQETLTGLMVDQAAASETLSTFFGFMPDYAENVSTLGESFNEFASGALNDTIDRADTLNTRLDNINGKKVMVDIELSTKARDQFTQLIKEIVRAEGGKVPGHVPGAGR